MEEIIRCVLFGSFLFAAACQDARVKSIGIKLYLIFGAAGMILVLFNLSAFADYLLGCAVGALLLFLSRITGGAIGEGDGLFFIVSGFYTGFTMNLRLFIYGVFLNGIICLIIYIKGVTEGEDRRSVTVPFLPCLIPVWIGLELL